MPNNNDYDGPADFDAVRKLFEAGGKKGALSAANQKVRKSAFLAENTDRQRRAFMEATVRLVIMGQEAGMATQTMIEVFEGALENLKRF